MWTSPQRDIKRLFGWFLLFPAQANIRTTALWTTGFGNTEGSQHFLVLFRSFDRFASYISSSPFWHPQSFRFFGTISIISAVSLHFLFDIQDIIFQCSGELVILILLLTFFYAKKTLNSELLNCKLQNVFYLNLAKAVFLLSLTKNKENILALSKYK